MKQIRLITFVRDLSGDLWIPDGEIPANGYPVVLVIHGGAWRALDRSAMAGICEMLCNNGLAVFNIDYRLAPEHPYPAGLEDCRTAAAFLYENAEKYHLNRKLLFILGASAGGHYALLTGLCPENYQAAGIISISGINDIYADFVVHKERYELLLGTEPVPELLREINPSTYCRENAPEVFCTHFNEDQVVPVECCRAFVAEAEKHKMKVGAYYYNLSREGQGHGIWIPEKLPEKELYPDISANIIYFINHIINRKQQP